MSHVNAMESVVAESSSIYSTYIATIDHLPCDIVRSLWLVQSCNLAAEKESHKLNLMLLHENAESVLQKIKQGNLEIVKAYAELKKQIQRFNAEAVAEMESLCDQLSTHEQMVSKEISQLQTMVHAPERDNLLHSAQLRAQLIEHYRKNPLASQVEALKEQEYILRKLDNVIISKSPGTLTGLKIVFKLSGDKKPTRSKAEMSKSRGLDRTHPKSRTGRGKWPKQRISKKETQLKVAQPFEEMVEPIVEAEPEKYCFCKQPSFGDMIACDNEKCPNGEWFHYKCVGLLNRVEALKYNKQKWFCSPQCRETFESRQKRKRHKSRKNRW